MSRDDAPSTGNRLDHSRSPESGLLEGVREWTDVFPWLRLTRTLRVAGSPPLVFLTLLALLVWWLGIGWIFGATREMPGFWGGVSGEGEIAGRDRVQIDFLSSVLTVAYQTMPWSLYQPVHESAKWRVLLGTVWTLLVWTPIALLLTRQGALLSAGRPMMGFQSAVRFAIARVPQAWLAAITPTICITMMAMVIWVLGKLSILLGGFALIEIAVAWMVSVIAVLAGLLAFGSHFAIPLGWAAIANEQHPDPLDSLSRGYEYLLRRPLRLTAYLLLAVILASVIGVLLFGIAWSALMVVQVTLREGVAMQSLVVRVAAVLAWFPVAGVATLSWAMVGGVYLLLRHDAGEQEVEDLWMPPIDTPVTLPVLRGFDKEAER